jgi:5-methylcytosine-specific restriction protein B
MSFTWIPIYSEIARKVLAFESRQDELLDLLTEMRSEGMKVILLNDRDAEGTRIALEEIDPFTFFASFNRTSSVSGRQAMLAKIKGAWDLSSAVPDDFDGIPLANAQNSWSFGYREGRGEGDVGLLWRVAKAASGASWRSFDWGLFDQALGIRQMGFAKLTTSLFWVEPMGFLPGDKHTEAYFRQRGIVLSSRTGAGYAAWLDAVESMGIESFADLQAKFSSAEIQVIELIDGWR